MWEKIRAMGPKAEKVPEIEGTLGTEDEYYAEHGGRELRRKRDVENTPRVEGGDDAGDREGDYEEDGRRRSHRRQIAMCTEGAERGVVNRKIQQIGRQGTVGEQGDGNRRQRKRRQQAEV